MYIRYRRHVLCLLLICLLLPFNFVLPAAIAQSDICQQPKPVCDAKAAVFLISAFDPVGSAVRISPTQLVTARHLVADKAEVTLFLSDGRPIKANVIPTDYPGDLVLIESQELPPGPALKPGPFSQGGALYSVAVDVSQRRIRAYDPGRLKFAPPPNKPLARLHHNAFSQPGNSGGALVNKNAELVGIIASGGEGRFEAIPAYAIKSLSKVRSPEIENKSAEIGAAVRICTTLLEYYRNMRRRLDEQQAKAIETSCRRSGNRQFFDLAAQTLSRSGRLSTAIGLFETALAEDPNAINTRISLAIAFHLARDYELALPHLRWLMSNIDGDLQVLRLTIQAGTWAGDKELAQQALLRLKELNPRSAPAAERFINKPPPRPPKLR